MRRPLALDDPRRPLSVVGKVNLATEIVASYVRVRWLLARTDLPQAIAALRDGQEATGPRENTANDHLAGIRLGRIVGRSLGALPFDARCLVRSLVLINLLARRGITGSLLIGVRSQPDFAAHAWVESGGRPLLPPMETEYRRLVEI